ncbi:MAG: hypothetical protein E4H33_01035, partial [Anaerolineales bacterium]
MIHEDILMAKQIKLCLLIVALLLSGCSQPDNAATPKPEVIENSDVLSTATILAMTTPVTTPKTPPLALDHQPLYWFAPLNLEKYGRGSVDYMDLFTPDADWNEAASHLQVFKLYGGWAETGPFYMLEQAIQAIRQRGLGLAIEHSPLFPDDTCGRDIEGFAGPGFLKAVQRVKDAGGTL